MREPLRWIAMTLLAATTLGFGGARDDGARPAAAVLRDVGFDQCLGASLPLDREFTDEAGRPVHLGDCLEDRPVVLALVYYRCPMLCTLVLNGLLRGARAVSLDAGRDYEIIAVSIDPRETADLARAKKAEYVANYGRSDGAGGWRFLTGPEESIRALTRSVGFRYSYDAATGQFAHASGVVVVTPSGKVSRYLLGIEYAPRDLRLGLVEASAGKIGTLVDQVLLICFHYDPTTGRYGLAIMTLLRALGIATLLALGGLVLVHLRRERRGRRRERVRPGDLGG